MSKPIGVIGLGRMGAPMARNILDAGYDVRGYDVREEAIVDLKEAGGQGVNAPKELATDCDTVLVIVQNESQTRETILGEDGLLAGDPSELTIVVSATVSPEAVRDLEAETPDTISLVDAPLCRGDDAAEEGNLLVLAGGQAETFESVRAVLEAIAGSDDLYYMGDLGLGEVAKTANNVLLWSALVADVEVFELCESYGMDIDELTNALAKSSGTNWGVNNWTERYPRQIPWAHKDMRIAIEMAEEQDLTMPSAGLLREQVRELQTAWANE